MDLSSVFHNRVAQALASALAGRVADGERALSPHTDPFSLAGSALIKALQALLSEDAADVAAALAQLEGAQSAVEAGKQDAAVLECLSSELTLFTCLLLFRSGSMLRGAYYLRKAWKGYERCLQAYAHLEAESADLCSMLNFGAGFFLFGCSMLPSAVGYVLSAIGFVVDRSRGLVCLRKAAAARGGYMAPFAQVMLLWVARFFSNDTVEARRLLAEGLQDFPGSPVWLYLGSYVLRNDGDLAGSVAYLIEARENARETKQFALSCIYELGATYLLQLEWQQAADKLLDFLNQTTAPSFRAYAAYQLGIALTMLGDEAGAKLWFSKVKGWTRSAYSWDVYAARKSRAWLDSGGMTDTDRLLVTAEILVEAKQFKTALEPLSLVRGISDAHLAMHAYLSAQCWRYLGDVQQATALFEQALQRTAHAETWIAPHCHVELAEIYLFSIADQEAGLACLARANGTPGGYDFEKPLSRRIGAITLRLNTAARAVSRPALVPSRRGSSTAVSSSAPAPASLELDEEEWVATNTAAQLLQLDTVVEPAAPPPAAEEFELVSSAVVSEQTREVQRCMALLQDIPLHSAWKGMSRHTKCFSGQEALQHLGRKGLDAETAIGLLKLCMQQEQIHEVEFSSFFLSENYYRFPSASNSAVLNVLPAFAGPRRRFQELRVEIYTEWQHLLESKLCFKKSSVDLHQLWLTTPYVRLIDRVRMLPTTVLEFENDAERRAFWINMYNILSLHSVSVYGSPTTASARKTFFRTCSYNIGGQVWSLDDIEHGVLRRNAKPPYSLSKLFAASDPRCGQLCEFDDNRIHFALNCGAVSCPAIQLYTGLNLSQQLDAAARDYLKAVVVQGNTVSLPRILKWYDVDFPKDVLSYLVQYVPALAALSNLSSLKIVWLPYDWSSIGVGLSSDHANLK